MAQPTITRHWNWWACIAYTLMLAALVFYFYVRIRCGGCGVIAAPPGLNVVLPSFASQCRRALMTPCIVWNCQSAHTWL
jgi:hypothetical protein